MEDDGSSSTSGKSDTPSDANAGADDELAVAQIKKTPWRGWIWSVPLAAMILVAFLIVRTWLLSGPTVVVTFPTASGLNPRGTGVFCHGVQVGQLQSLTLSHHGKMARATLSMDGSAAPYLRKGSRFYIQQPNLLNGNLAGLISGPVIELLPGKGPSCRRFQGRLRPPLLTPHSPGSTIAIATPQLGNLRQGSPVYYRGLNAGKVLGWRYSAKKNMIFLRVFVRSPFNHWVTRKTRFWRLGGFNISARGPGINFEMPPLAVILNGGLAFAPFNAVPAPAHKCFKLYATSAAARDAGLASGAQFAVVLKGNVGRLHRGSPVTFDGRRVGEVINAGFRYSSAKGQMVTPITIALSPRKFGIRSVHHANQTLANVINHLVHAGLRVQASRANLILGGRQVALVMTGEPITGTLPHAGGLLQLPTSSAASLGSIVASIRRISAKINALPIEKIGANVERLSARAAAMVNSAEMKNSIRHLDRALANIQAITHNARGHIGVTIDAVRQAAQQAAKMLRAVRSVVGGRYIAQQNVRSLIAELVRMARAIRSLANYLDAHPEALLEGRTK